MSEVDLEHWDPLSPGELASIFEGRAVRWWIAGGYAIDMFVQELDRRRHDDVDIGVLAVEQQLVRSQLGDWDLHCADPPGTLRPWPAGEVLREPVHDVWAREREGAPWRFQLVLNPSAGDLWIYRRERRIRRSLDSITARFEGVPYLAPEIQLLFKSKSLRPKDDEDFEAALPVLGRAQRRWLSDALRKTAPDHPWLRRL